MTYNEAETRFYLIDPVLRDKGYGDCTRFHVQYVFATNGHCYGEFDKTAQLPDGPFPFPDFPSHTDLTARYAKDTGVDIRRPEASMLFMADSVA